MQKGIAEQLQIKDLTSSSLTEKIGGILSNERYYKANIVAASKVFRDQKDKPLERGLWWIEWAMRNPNASHFKSSGSDLTFVQIQSLDVIAFLLLVLALIAYISFIILKKVFIMLTALRSKGGRKNKLE